MSTDSEDWMLNALKSNAQRRRSRYAEAEAEGAAYLVECRDLWDAFDADAGIYFVMCADEAAVDELIARFDGDEWGRVLGIYNVGHPLEPQGRGLTLEEWKGGQRLYRHEAP